MKKIVFFLLMVFLAAAFAGCKKHSYIAAFEQSPQERIGEQIRLVEEKLTTAENGWIGVLPTGLGGGYGFYMTFDADRFVNMYADLMDSSASKARQSQYRVKADMGADLVFDTYTYITLLNDPDASAFGGNTRDGFRSDIDFIYDRSSEDSIVFIGKRYRQTFSLVKATASQKARYLNGEYVTSIKTFKKFFTDNPNAYVVLDNGSKASLEPNTGNSLLAGKRITLTTIAPDGTVAAANGKFAFTIDNMQILDSGVSIAGTRFVKLAWKDASTLALYSSTGKEYIINNNPTPLLPLYKLWGSKYNALYDSYKTIYPGTSAAGADTLNYYHNNLNNGALLGFSFNWGSLKMSWDIVNKRMKLDGFCSQNGGTSGWTTTITYNYTVDNNGVYTFTVQTPATGGYVAKILTKLDNFIRNNRITFDYHLDNGMVYGKMSSTDSPSTVMTFVLQ
jgi:hypothetical protein